MVKALPGPLKTPLTLMLIALLAVVLVLLWMRGRYVEDNESAMSVMPSPVHAATGATVDAGSDMRSLESLWQRYERLNNDLPAADVSPVSAPDRAATEIEVAPDVTRQQRREQEMAARAEREARLAALYAARDEVVVQATRAPLGDGSDLADAMGRFADRLADTGANSVVDFNALTSYIRASARIQQLTQQVIAESSRGQEADIKHVQELSEEIQQLQRLLPGNLVDTSALGVGAWPAQHE